MTTDLVPVEPDWGTSRARALAATFIATKKTKPNTLDAYQRDLTLWLGWCERNGVDPLDAWTAHVQLWLAELATGNPAVGQKPERGTTQARRLGAVSAWYRWLVRHHSAARNPVTLEPSERPTRAPRKAAALSADHAEKLLAAAERDSPRAALIVALMVYDGLRVGEVTAADAADIHMVDGEMVLSVHGKGGKTRDVRLNAYVLGRWRAYQAARPDAAGRLPVPVDQAGAGTPVPLVATYRGGRIDRKEVRRLLLRLAKVAGLPVEAVTGIKPHGLRATYATRSFAGGLDARAIQVTMGHVSMDTTTGYDRSQVTADRDPAIRLLGLIKPPGSR